MHFTWPTYMDILTVTQINLATWSMASSGAKYLIWLIWTRCYMILETNGINGPSRVGPWYHGIREDLSIILSPRRALMGTLTICTAQWQCGWPHSSAGHYEATRKMMIKQSELSCQRRPCSLFQDLCPHHASGLHFVQCASFASGNDSRAAMCICGGLHNDNDTQAECDCLDLKLDRQPGQSGLMVFAEPC